MEDPAKYESDPESREIKTQTKTLKAWQAQILPGQTRILMAVDMISACEILTRAGYEPLLIAYLGEAL